MVLRYGMDMMETHHGFGRDTDFSILHIKREVSYTIQHDTLPILKNHCIVAFS